MSITKADPCSCELRSSISKHFLRTRDFLDISQMEFASELNIDRRSYIDIEHSENLCCTMTLLIYLCYFCKDPAALLSDCKDIFDKYLPPPKYPS